MDSKTKKVLDNLPGFFQTDIGSNNFKFVKSFEEDLDFAQQQITKLKESIQISTAAGDELDSIGAIFVLPRNPNENDSQYRDRIIGFWPGYAGGGTIWSIQQKVERITGITPDKIQISEWQDSVTSAPLKFRVNADVGFDADLGILQDVLEFSKAAGTWLIFDLTSRETDIYDLYSENVEISLTEFWFTPDNSYLDYFDKLL